MLNRITSGLARDIQEKILSQKINFLYDDRPLLLRTPQAELGSGRIILQDIHFAFLWCCSYATVAFNTMYYEKAPTAGNVVTFGDRPEIQKVMLTLNWARSLTKEITWWPMEAARPDQPDKWTESANNLFEACAAYLVLHEIAHVINDGDLEPLMNARRDPFYEISKEECQRIFKAEQEADIFALEALIGSSVLHEVRLIKYLGAALAHLSNCYILDTPDTRQGPTHPDLDDRLRTVIQKAVLTQEDDQIQLKAHLIVGVQLFLILTGRDFIPEYPEQADYANFDDLEKYLFDLIRQMKEAARSRGWE